MAARFYGYVKDSNSQPLSGAYVEWTCNTFAEVVGTDTTDANGYYDITDAAARNHNGHCEQVGASKSGYLGQVIQMLGWSGNDTQVDFTLTPE